MSPARVAWAAIAAVLLLAAAAAVRRAAPPPAFAHPLAASCASRANDGAFAPRPRAAGGACAAGAWAWPAATKAACAFRTLDGSAAAAALAGATVLIAGDSTGRHVYGALLRLLTGDPTAAAPVGHRDASHGPLAGAIMLRYAWAPFLQNATAAVDGWGGAGGAGRAPPTLALFSQSLWHMLHDGDAGEGYAAGLAALAGALEAAAARGAAPADGVAVASVPSVAHARLSAADKKATMTPARVDSFNRALDAVFGGGRVPGAALVDARRVTGAAGAACTQDGIHYAPGVYDALLQVWLNAVVAAQREAGGGGSAG
jgi:hypothetical protein